MPTENRTVAPSRRPGTVRTEDGEILTLPADWALLPPGDAGLTRKVKAGGPTWTVVKRRGRRRYSQGVWAPKERIEAARAEVAAARATQSHERQRASAKRRRDAKQADYVVAFRRAVQDFLAFIPEHQELARKLAAAVAAHATPVGSGTVARTQRIPVERRAEAALIAWMRHQTTAYDDMAIPRVKGLRRDIRRQLAARSRRLLAHYRNNPAPLSRCPLVAALATTPPPTVAEALPFSPPPKARGGWARDPG